MDGRTEPDRIAIRIRNSQFRAPEPQHNSAADSAHIGGDHHKFGCSAAGEQGKHWKLVRAHVRCQPRRRIRKEKRWLSPAFRGELTLDLGKRSGDLEGERLLLLSGKIN